MSAAVVRDGFRSLAGSTRRYAVSLDGTDDPHRHPVPDDTRITPGDQPSRRSSRPAPVTLFFQPRPRRSFRKGPCDSTESIGGHPAYGLCRAADGGGQGASGRSVAAPRSACPWRFPLNVRRLPGRPHGDSVGLSLSSCCGHGHRPGLTRRDDPLSTASRSLHSRSRLRPSSSGVVMAAPSVEDDFEAIIAGPDRQRYPRTDPQDPVERVKTDSRPPGRGSRSTSSVAIRESMRPDGLHRDQRVDAGSVFDRATAPAGPTHYSDEHSMRPFVSD